MKTDFRKSTRTRKAAPSKTRNKALCLASRDGDLAEVETLIDEGADIHWNNDEALRSAAMYGRTEVVRKLVTHGANIHANNDEALRWAAANGWTEMAKVLIARGADVFIMDRAPAKLALINDHQRTGLHPVPKTPS